jgi:hypothetical protein
MAFPSRISKTCTTRRRIGAPLGVSVADDVAEHYDVIASINELLDLDLEVSELLDELLVPEAVPHFVTSAIHSSIGELRYLVPLDVGI